jgi:hypothetical protein
MGDRRAKDNIGGEGVASDWLGWVVACLVVAVGTSGAARDGDGRGGVGAEGGSGDGGGDRGGAMVVVGYVCTTARISARTDLLSGCLSKMRIERE